MPRNLSVADLTSEREDLEELLMLNGYSRFVRHVLDEWTGLGYRQRMTTALKNPDPNEAKVIDRLSVEIERVLRWPAGRVRELGGKGVTE